MPTGQPWQKVEPRVSPAEDRYLMTVVATASNPRFSVSRVDIDRGGPTYTADTLTDLRARYPDAELYFITGADALAQILSWHGCEELFELAHFVGRHAAGLRAGRRPTCRTARSALVEVPAMAISSTDCRAGGRRAAGLVPRARRRGPVHLQNAVLYRQPESMALADESSRRAFFSDSDAGIRGRREPLAGLGTPSGSPR